MSRPSIKLNAVQTLALSFFGLILVGGLLLSLPFASRGWQAMPFLDALFTAASASCVTGLVVCDTYTQFTLFGQAVILVLIQIGGLSLVTVASLVSLLLHQRIGLHRRAVLMDTVGALQVGGIIRLTRRALWVTALLEGCGAVALTFWFCPRYGFFQGLWMSLFHAVSSFCNAGFDLLGTGASLTSAAGEAYLNVVLMLLVVAGGLGFLVWDDLLTHRFHIRRWRLHSKIVLSATMLLFFGGAAAFYILERDHAFAGLPTSQKILMAFFQSVTTRTAGFNTADFSALSQSGILLTMVLMFVGAGSGSTGGGIKVNTLAVLVLSAAAQVRRREDVNVFHRRLDEATVQKAFSSVCMYFLACLAGGMVLCLQGAPLDSAMFEAISAVGTVGLSLSLTPTLPIISKIAVIALMFAGRVGSMSVAMAVTRSRPTPRLRNVSEKILIG